MTIYKSECVSTHACLLADSNFTFIIELPYQNFCSKTTIPDKLQKFWAMLYHLCSQLQWQISLSIKCPGVNEP